MIENAVKRIIKRLFPELTTGLHLPQWGRVVNVQDYSSGVSDEFEPLYAVDVQLLDDDGEATKTPVLEQVPLPANSAGNQRGFFGFPELGALVELGFIRGLPNKPFIRTVLIEGLTVPGLRTKALTFKHSEEVFQQATQEGEWLRETTEDIMELCQNYNEKIEKVKSIIAGEEFNAKAKKIWLGDNNTNVLALLSELMGIVQELANTLANHQHLGVQGGTATSGTPVTASKITQVSTSTKNIKNKLDPFVS